MFCDGFEFRRCLLFQNPLGFPCPKAGFVMNGSLCILVTRGPPLPRHWTPRRMPAALVIHYTIYLSTLH
jgi:hypothetical protein